MYWSRIWRHLHAKMHSKCNIEKSHVLYFQILLSFVPTLFHFLYFPFVRFGPGPLVFPSRWPVAAVVCDELSLI